MKNLKCYATPRSAPSHVSICLERAMATLEDTMVFIRAISPEALPEGVHAALLEATVELGHTIGQAKFVAPTVKRRA